MATTDPLLPRISRRTLFRGTAGVAGAAALGPLLAACSSSGSDDSGGTVPNTMSPSATGTQLVLVPQFDPNTFITTGGLQRAVVTVVDSSNSTPAGLPDSLSFTVIRDGEENGETLTATKHGDGVPKPYYPLTLNPTAPGLYRIKAALPGESVETLVQVQPAKQTTRPTPGAPMTVVDTPTTGELRGVNPLCTQESPCPLHALNLRDALAAGKPTALLISTPRYCQIGVCGPVLALVLEQQAAYPDVQFIHAEVFADPVSGSRQVAPAVAALDLDYEPMFATIGADGVVRARLDNVFDRAEIAAALAAART